MNKFNFTKETGRWKLPATIAEYEGELTIKENSSVELELRAVPAEEMDRFDEPKILITTTGATTAYKCSRISQSYSSPKHYNVKLSVAYLIKNSSFLGVDSMLFSKLSVSFTQMNEWVNTWGLKRKSVSEEDALFEFSYTRPASVTINQTESSVSQIQFSARTELKRSTSTITEDVEYNITSAEATMSLEHCVEEVLLFRDLLFILFDRPVKIRYVRLLGAPHLIPHTPGFNPPIFLYIPETPYPARNIEQKFPVKFSSIKGDLGKILHNWRQLREKLKPVMEIYLEQIVVPFSTHTNAFLNIVQAIETYHRRMFDNQRDMNEDEHKKRVRAVIEAAPPEYREFVQGRMAFSNEPTLMARLQEFLKKVDADIVNFLIIESDFIKEVKDSRNYYTHYSKELEKKAAKDHDLWNNTLILRLFLGNCIFKDLEILNETTKKEFNDFHYIPNADMEK